ncbi:membrane protein FxsA [Rhizobium sp. S-51]|uniref:Membrane protein FxsA n=1 Tax=Rhizobium terricola TaxID=2728849 RepID=A0A7Y0AXV1_9HYPH|nr:FxsA family protein [Rhizobium terricola]NML75505.1 membrane protein FxsA [Rhizobium terricola]
MRIPLAILLLLPLAEIATFVFVGKYIGVLATLALIILSGVVGLLLLRIQGAGVLRRLQTESRNEKGSAREITRGAMIVVGAFLLLIPGFLTDILGILLFIPFVREFVWSLVRPHVTFAGASHFSYRTNTSSTERDTGRSTVIDLDTEDYQREPNRQSPWSSVRDGRED